MQQLGLHIPEEVGFVSLSTRDEHPDVSGMTVPIEAMAGAVVDVVVAQVLRNERGLPKTPKCVLVEGAWHEGTTLRPFG